MKPAVTVVLPVYNVEPYLDRCIASVVGQTCKELEIILVDDGSTDGCSEICDAWAEKDCRIRVIHKQNEGLGMARNTGIENASGEYICFFDSDDYIAPDTVECSLATARKYKADVVVFGFTPVKKTGAMEATIIPHPHKMVYEGAEVTEVFLPDLVALDLKSGEQTGLYMSACMALFSVELIRRAGWRFISERQIISEDVYSLLRLYRHVQTVAVLPKACYFYCENQTSLTHVYRQDRFEKINQFYEACQAICQELNYCDEVRFRLDDVYFSFAIAALKQLVAAKQSGKLRELKNIIENKQFHQVSGNIKSCRVRRAKRILAVCIYKKWTFLCLLLVSSQNLLDQLKKIKGIVIAKGKSEYKAG